MQELWLPLVHSSSKLAVSRLPIGPHGPSCSPTQPAGPQSGFHLEPVPISTGHYSPTDPALRANPFQKFGSILPTSFIYIVPLIRGCSPWRPAAVMSMAGHDNHLLPRILTGHQERTGCNKRCGALPGMWPYLRANQYQDDSLLIRKENSSWAPAGVSEFGCVAALVPESTTFVFRFGNIDLIPFQQDDAHPKDCTPFKSSYPISRTD